MKIFYHLADADGKCSSYLVKRFAKHTDNYDIEFCGINYGMDFPFEKIQKDEQVFIVDYSIFPEEMNRLLDITKNVVWIDHHKSSIQRYEGFEKEIPGIRYDGIAGCALTYCYLTQMSIGDMNEVKEFNPELTNNMPQFVSLIADYDVWNFKYGDVTKNFHAGLMLEEHNPWDEIWDIFLVDNKNDYIYKIVNNGIIAKQSRASMMKTYCETKGFETELDGYKAFAINMANISSEDFVSVDDAKYDLFIGFSYNGKDWNYSLRSTKVDCAEIAMKFGGGGHMGAAGFNSDKLLLSVIKSEEVN